MSTENKDRIVVRGLTDKEQAQYDDILESLKQLGTFRLFALSKSFNKESEVRDKLWYDVYEKLKAVQNRMEDEFWDLIKLSYTEI